jgi:hypothetical protein
MNTRLAERERKLGSSVMRSVLAFAVPVLVALAAGCGSGGGSGSDIEQAQDAVRDYVIGIAEGDGDRSCGRMSNEAQQQLADQVAEQEPRRGIDSCEEAVARLSELLTDENRAPWRDPRIDVTLTRDKAIASVKDGPTDVTVIKVDDEWLVDERRR